MEFVSSGLITAVSVIDTAAETIGRVPANTRRVAHRIATADASEWAAAIERGIRVTAVVFAFLFVIGSIIAETLFMIGGQFCRALDERNDQLAALWVRLWTGAPAAPVVEPPAAEPPAAPVAEPVLALPLAPTAPRPARRSRAAKAAPAPAAAPRRARRSRRAVEAVAA